MPDVNRRPSPGTPDAPIGELVRQAAEQVSRLARQELALAQLEVTRKARRAGIGAGLFGGAGVLAGYGLATLLAAVALGLAEVMDGWLAGLLVAVVLFAIAAVLAVFGRRQLRRATPLLPQEAVRNVRADIDAVKDRLVAHTGDDDFTRLAGPVSKASTTASPTLKPPGA